jgi:competence protein ComEC
MSSMRAWLMFVALAFAPIGAFAKTLDVYFIDVEGGQSTLIVTPAGESLLIDVGWDGFNARDAKRIIAAAHGAGLTQIDYLLITHFHGDHDGGVPELARLIPIRTFIDYGTPIEKGSKVSDPFEAYSRVRGKGQHLQPKPGDRLPLTGIDVDVVSARGTTISKPLSGAGQPNAACASFEKRANDFTENARSLGVRVQFGRFRLADLGDLVWNKLGQLVCPDNLIGEVDVYLVAHHGNANAAVPALVAALRPRVAIMNNGETKGGERENFATLHGLSGLEDVWQLHRSANKGVENADAAFIANLDERTGHPITLTASEDGSFTVTNGRTGVSKRYEARPAQPSAAGR